MLGKELVEAVFDDWKTAPVSEEVRCALGIIEVLTLRPDELDLSDARALELDDQAIENVVAICSLFNMIVRVADSLGFEVPPPEVMERGVPMMLKHGYA